MPITRLFLLFTLLALVNGMLDDDSVEYVNQAPADDGDSDAPHQWTPKSKLASVCYDPHVDVGNTDLGWCGVDYSEANCWRVIKAPRDSHVLLKWNNIKKPSTERLNVYDYQDGEWYKVGKIVDGEMVPKWGVISHARRLCIHFVTDRSFLQSGASLRWKFTRGNH